MKYKDSNTLELINEAEAKFTIGTRFNNSNLDSLLFTTDHVVNEHDRLFLQGGGIVVIAINGMIKDLRTVYKNRTWANNS